MTLKELALRDNNIMRIAKLETISHVICNTDKGQLTLMLRKNGSEQDYRLVLDAVPFTDKENEEMLSQFIDILFTL